MQKTNVELKYLAKELEALESKFPKTKGIGLSVAPALVFWGKQLGLPKYEECFNALQRSNLGKGSFSVGDVNEMNTTIAFTTDDKKAHLTKTKNGTIVYDVCAGLKEVCERLKNYDSRDAEIDILKKKVRQLEISNDCDDFRHRNYDYDWISGTWYKCC